MKSNRQARLLMLDTSDGNEHVLNISNHKRQYFSKWCTYCIKRKHNIGQARWARYEKMAEKLQIVKWESE